MFFKEHVIEFPTLICLMQFKFGVLESLEHFIFLEFKKSFTFRIIIGIMKNQSCLPLRKTFYVLTFPCLFMYITSSYM